METIVEERWRDVRRSRLLEAATRIFAQVGYEAASVEDIAFEAGFGSAVSLRQHFAARLSVSPAQYRRSFSL